MKMQLKTPEEAKERFDILAQVIDQGMMTTIVVGHALREIKEQELWKAGGFETFEAMIDARWGWTKRYANQLILNAEMINGLPENIRKLLTSGAAQKEMAKVPALLRPEIALLATAGGTKPATAKSVKKAAPKSAPPPRPKAGKKSSPPPRGKVAAAAKPAVPELPKDNTGCEIPLEIQPLWDRAGEVQELISYASAIRSKIEKVQGFGDPLFMTIDFADTIAKLDQVKENIREAKPYAICATCGGKTPKDCQACKGRGFVSEFYWNTCVPADVKALRKPKE
jgi:predicted transcriptional regulator